MSTNKKQHAQHTPGPWETEQDDNDPETWLVFTHGDMGGVHATVTTTEADARLIAAAPDLKEALAILLVQMGEYRDGDGAAKYHAINIARAALSKAEGRDP